MKYMVMECHLSYAVVLDENGSFLKVANMRYEVGQTVENVVEMASEVKGLSSKGYKKRFKALMATAACIIAALTAVLGVELMPCGSVYLNINPAVRLDVNRRDKVIGLEGLNTDGESLIDGYAYRRKDVETVTDELVDRAVDMGYLHEGGTITITLDSDDDEWTASRGEAISESLGRHLDGKLSVTITVTDSAARTFEAVIPVESGDDDVKSFERRIVKINNQKVSSQAELGAYFSAVWLTLSPSYFSRWIASRIRQQLNRRSGEGAPACLSLYSRTRRLMPSAPAICSPVIGSPMCAEKSCSRRARRTFL